MNALALKSYQFYLLPVLFGICQTVYSQVSDFNVIGVTCRNEALVIENQSTAADRVEWDFCQDGLKHASAASQLENTAIALPFGIEIIYDHGKWFGFVGSLSTHAVFRLNFGDDPNGIPEISQIASFGGGQIKIIQENNSWYAIGLGGNGSFVRMAFGSSLEATPVVEDLTNLGWSGTSWGLDVVKDGDNHVAIVADYGASVLRFVNFGNSIANPVTPASVTTVAAGNPDLSGPVRVEFMKDQNRWFALVNSLNNGNVLLMNFGSTLISEPSTTVITNLSNPAGLAFIKDGLEYFGLVSGAAGKLIRVEFGKEITETPEAFDVPGLGELEISYAFSAVQLGNNWSVYLMGFYNQNIYKINFTDQCDDVSAVTSDELEPNKIKYTTAGEKYIGLTTYGADGNTSFIGKEIVVISSEAPAVEINHDGNCISSSVAFSAISDEEIADFQWDFGDLSPPQSSATPAHLYPNPGSYSVKLNVISVSGCSNLISKELKIFSKPEASFNFSDGQLCTNSEVTFSNETADVYEGLLTYEWFIDGEPIADVRNPDYIFEFPGIFEVKLIASIPGCDDAEIKSTPEIKAGPTMEFSMESYCEADFIHFTSTLSEPALEYHWTFGDGQISDEAHPVHKFDSDGQYEISLLALSDSGCSTKRTEVVTIHDNPTPEFEILSNEPFCSGLPVEMLDLTPPVSDGVIDSVRWDFSDETGTVFAFAGASVEHGFANEGAYEITLVAKTSWGCTGTIERTINILPSPEINLSHTGPCVGVPVNFLTSASENISSWQWTINDKKYNSPDPTHTFRVPGTYVIELIAEGLNGCAASLNKGIIVPAQLEADFSIFKNCVNEATVFTDITTGSDKITEWEWQINNGEDQTGSQLQLVFEESGEQTVTMTITTESGCSYLQSKTVTIVPSPEASFMMSSEIGSPPFPVNFTNHSEDASDYAWDFGDGNISNEASPAHEYTEVGEFTITLTASNPEGCEHSSTKEISISPAQPDIRIMAVTATENPDKTVGVMVILHNDGNTIIYDLPLDIDISGTVQVREVIEGPVLPRSRVNFSLGYGVRLTEDISFLCATATLAGDVEPETNRNCIEFSSEVVFLPGYPNPATEFLQIEWVAPQEETVRASLRNLLGNEIWTLQFSSEKGLNQKTVEVQNLQKGIYMLILESPRVTTMQRILIAR